VGNVGGLEQRTAIDAVSFVEKMADLALGTFAGIPSLHGGMTLSVLLRRQVGEGSMEAILKQEARLPVPQRVVRTRKCVPCCTVAFTAVKSRGGDDGAGRSCRKSLDFEAVL
jgi:hypothetical protein